MSRFVTGENLPLHDALDVIELIQGFEGSKAVDVQVKDFVTYLSQYGVVELEETQLHAFACLAEMSFRMGHW